MQIDLAFSISEILIIITSFVISILGTFLLVFGEKNNCLGSFNHKKRNVVIILILNFIITISVVIMFLLDFFQVSSPFHSWCHTIVRQDYIFDIYDVGAQLFFLYYIADGVARFKFCTLGRILQWKQKKY